MIEISEAQKPTVLRNLALDLLEVHHFFGQDMVTRDQWITRFTKDKTRLGKPNKYSNRERAWERFKLKAKRSMFADDLTWPMTKDYTSLGQGSRQPMACIKVGPYLREFVEEVLDEIADHVVRVDRAKKKISDAKRKERYGV